MSGQPKQESRTIRLCFLGDPLYDRRIRNFAAYFAANGWQTQIWYGSTEPSALASTPECRLVHIQTASLQGVFRFISYDRRLRHGLSAADSVSVTMACDLYSLSAAARTKAESSFLVYDAREVYTQLPTVERRWRVRNFWRARERQGLRRTNLVVVTAPLDADAIRTVHGSLPPHLVVRNMPSRSDEIRPAIDLRAKLSIDSTEPIIAYVGGLQNGRGLEQTIAAMQQIEDVVLVLIGDGVLRTRLMAQSNSLGLSDRVKFFGPADSSDVLSLLRGADIGISLIERTSGSYRLALPSKVFEYLHAGLPVVSSPLEQVKFCFAGSPHLFYCNEMNPAEIITTIREALRYSRSPGLRVQIAGEAREQFTFEHDAAGLLEAIVKNIPADPDDNL